MEDGRDCYMLGLPPLADFILSDADHGTGMHRRLGRLAAQSAHPLLCFEVGDMKPAKTGLKDEDSRRIEVVLAMILAGREVLSIPDTGSQRNMMSPNAARQLNLEVDERAPPQDLQLADGRVVHSSGRVSTQYSFPGQESTPLGIQFDVMRDLVASIIVGQRFLDTTETLTKYAVRRLSTRPRPLTMPTRILHLHAPRRMLCCYLNEVLVSANADTGAEMNLVSADFAAQAGFSSQ